MMNWEKGVNWEAPNRHCHHCYREGFFDAGVVALLIIVLMIFSYGLDTMK